MKKIILSLALLFAFSPIANAYLVINPGSMEFGSVRVGTLATQMFTITNFGTTSVQIQGCNLFGTFQCQIHCFGTLPQGQSCSGTVRFLPQAERYEFQTAFINTSQGSLNMSVHGFGKL